MEHHVLQWDEEMIRQMVHTVKVVSKECIRVYLTDGTEIEQAVLQSKSELQLRLTEREIVV